MIKFVVLRWSELGSKKNNYYEEPLFFETHEDAEKACREWYAFLEGYPCNGDAFIAQLESL